VQHRLTTACAEYSTATAALTAALASRERFVNAGNKQGGMKQLPAKLDWKLSKAVHLPSEGVPAGFFASDLTALRAIEHEATEKAYDALLAAKDKHIAHLQQRCVQRGFVATAAEAFRPHLQRIAEAYNRESQADPLAPSQSGFTFPIAHVASYFATELQARLTAQTLAKVQADSLEQQRIAGERAQEHQAQETVLNGASTGQTIAMVAERAVQKQLAPMQKQLEQLLEQMQRQQPAQPQQHQQTHARHHTGRVLTHTPTLPKGKQYAGASRSLPRQSAGNHLSAKRTRNTDEPAGAATDETTLAVSFPNHPQRPPKRQKHVVVTVRPTNGAGGDRHHRQEHQQQRPEQPAEAPIRQQARHQGRGPRSDAQQQ